jgi:protease I
MYEYQMMLGFAGTVDNWRLKTMRRRTFSDDRSMLHFWGLGTVLLCLLAVGASGAGRPPQTAPRRGPLASRLQVVQLPAPSTSSAVSVEQAIVSLRSLQVPGNQRLDLPKVSQLAWAIQGAAVTAGASGAGAGPMAVDAATMKVYFVLPDGIHLYNPADHALQQVAADDEREALAAAVLKQTGAPTGGCQIILAAPFQEFVKRYSTRARTVMLLQAGRMSQNLQLEAVAQGLTFVGVDGPDAADVRRVVRALRTLEPVYVAFVGYPAGQAPAASDQGPTAQGSALFVVPPQQFQDEELLATRRALEQGGVPVLIASTRMGVLIGMFGGTIRADLLLNQANLDNFNAVVFIGGNGAIDYLNNRVVQNLITQAVAKRKVLAAIGTAPSILASAGVLKGARATAYISEQARLIQGGAIYTGNPAEKDGLIITATGPLAVAPFARGILDALGETGPSTAR